MIVTLTMNPAVDASAETARVVEERKLRCTAPHYEPGGGGINVARALRELGGEALAVYPAAGAGGTLLRGLLERQGVAQRPVAVDGETRQNLSVTERETGRQFRFVMPGPELAERDWRRCLDEIAALDPAPRYVVASGSLPPGVPADFYGRLARTAREGGARVVLDSSGDALRLGLEAGVYLAKPNRRELGTLAGRELGGEGDVAAAARSIVEREGAAVVLASLGEGGALLVAEGVEERIQPPRLDGIRSAVGAGDSTVAGLVLGLDAGDDVRRAARRGVAAGAAAVLTPGSELCRRADAERLYEQLLSAMVPA